MASFGGQFATSLLTTCNILVIMIMRTPPDIDQVVARYVNSYVATCAFFAVYEIEVTPFHSTSRCFLFALIKCTLDGTKYITKNEEKATDHLQLAGNVGK